MLTNLHFLLGIFIYTKQTKLLIEPNSSIISIVKDENLL